MDDILTEIVRRKEQGERMALASLVWSTGSIPMSERAKMIVAEEGDVVRHHRRRLPRSRGLECRSHRAGDRRKPASALHYDGKTSRGERLKLRR